MRTIALALAVLLATAHSVLGERYILMRLFRRPLPPLLGGEDFTRQTLRFAWHLTSVAFVGLAVVLVLLPPSARAAAQVIAATFALCGLIALGFTRGRHLSWIVFFALAALAWWG
jgi:hypothetical protein